MSTVINRLSQLSSKLKSMELNMTTNDQKDSILQNEYSSSSSKPQTLSNR